MWTSNFFSYNGDCVAFLMQWEPNRDQIGPVKLKNGDLWLLNCKICAKLDSWSEKMTPWICVSLNKGFSGFIKTFRIAMVSCHQPFYVSGPLTVLHCTAMYCSVLSRELRTTGSSCPSPLLMQMGTCNCKWEPNENHFTEMVRMRT